MINGLNMKLSPFKTHNKNYSEFVLSESRTKKIAILKKAAKAANADQRKIVKKAERLGRAK
jgi:16S rRNA G527 N7-methylase RsmG